jgi:hypothetical protein
MTNIPFRRHPFSPLIGPQTLQNGSFLHHHRAQYYFKRDGIKRREDFYCWLGDRRDGVFHDRGD